MKTNWKFLINVFIIVLIIHFIISTLDFKIDIKNPNYSYENFDGTSYLNYKDSSQSLQQQTQQLNPEDSMKFLTGDVENYEDFNIEQDLLNYINNNNKDIRPGNFYKKDYNTPHFNSNLTDVHSFYNINYDPNNCTHFGFDGVDFHKMMNDKSCQQHTAGSNAVAPSAVPMPQKMCGGGGAEHYQNHNYNQEENNTFQNVPLKNEDSEWRYKNDLPMNGGEFLPGLTGFSKLSDDYASIGGCGTSGSGSTFLKPSQFDNCTGNTYDLRYQKEAYNK